jgi:hypothetical protein
VAVAASLAACGDSSTDTDATSKTYSAELTDVSFPPEQRLGQTSLLRLGVRNTGDEAIPSLLVTIGIEGERGENSALPFGVRDPQPELASADRPVWVLAETYPRFVGSSDPGGATTANPKTFEFGSLEPGERTEVVWKLSAVRAGRYTLAYRVGAGETARLENSGGGELLGARTAAITAALPETEVNDRGEIVKIKRSQRP